MDIEWGVSKRSKVSKRGAKGGGMDRIVSSKLVFYVVGRSRVSRRRNLRNFSKIFGHEFATSNLGEVRESFSRPYFGSDTFANAGENFPFGKRVNRSCQLLSRKSTESSRWKRIRQRRVRWLFFFLRRRNLEDLSREIGMDVDTPRLVS